MGNLLQIPRSLDVRSPSLDPLKALLSGQQGRTQFDQNAQQQQAIQLQNQLGQQAGQPGFDPLQNQQLDQLSVLAPTEANNILANFNNLTKGRKQAFFDDIAKGKRLIDQGRVTDFIDLGQERRSMLIRLEGDTSDTDFALNLAQQAQQTGDLNPLKQTLQQGFDAGVSEGFLKDPKTRLGKKFKDQVQIDLFKSTRDAALTGDPRAVETFDAFKKFHGLDKLTPEAESRLLIETQQKIDKNKRRIITNEDIIKTAFSDRKIRRKSKFQLAQAQSAVKKATQGFAGSLKTFAAKIFPGIDVSDEALLSQSLTSFALDNLQAFKGPTTDFEFRVAERIAGLISDPQSSNQAKLNALSVSIWLSDREDDQFKRHRRDKEEAIDFEFSGGSAFRNSTVNEISNFALSRGISIQEALKQIKAGATLLPSLPGLGGQPQQTDFSQGEGSELERLLREKNQ